MSNSIQFDIKERYSLLKEEFDLLKEELCFYRNKLSHHTDHPAVSEQLSQEEFFATRSKIIGLRLEIMAKESYLEKLFDSIQMDEAEAERDYAALDIEALLDRVAQFPATDERKYARLMYLLAEFSFFEREGNKEGVVFYGRALTEVMNDK